MSAPLTEKMKTISSFADKMKTLSSSARSAAFAIRLVSRPLVRILDTPGDRHIERVIREILDGQPGRPAEIRLQCAVDMAQIIDRV